MNPNGKTIHYISEFNDKGQMIKEIFYCIDGETIDCIEEFNDKGRIIKKIIYRYENKN
ncbi:DUF2963 domain-containing protein [Candidatus Phytoplasma ziziphi]|uniref:DUF2963 domain-containing protein n=1 Tax=Ziziphus jujuba witches'-broom phytoplasma TaxID=135727 RepID=UPI003B968D59